MRSVILTVAGMGCSALWLGLLVATQFNPVSVSLGLLVMVYATGSTTETRPNAVRARRSR